MGYDKGSLDSIKEDKKSAGETDSHCCNRLIIPISIPCLPNILQHLHPQSTQAISEKRARHPAQDTNQQARGRFFFLSFIRVHTLNARALLVCAPLSSPTSPIEDVSPTHTRLALQNKGGGGELSDKSARELLNACRLGIGALSEPRSNRQGSLDVSLDRRR